MLLIQHLINVIILEWYCIIIIIIVFLLQALENEIGSHEPQLMSVVAVGDDLVQRKHFGADRIKERLQEILGMWQHLIDAAAYRRKRLEEAVDFHQVILYIKCNKKFTILT